MNKAQNENGWLQWKRIEAGDYISLDSKWSVTKWSKGKWALHYRDDANSKWECLNHRERDTYGFFYVPQERMRVAMDYADEIKARGYCD